MGIFDILWNFTMEEWYYRLIAILLGIILIVSELPVWGRKS